MDRLSQIEIFVSVAPRGTLTAASRVEGVAPGRISRRLDPPDERLGVKLLVPSTREVTLTCEGVALLEGLPARARRAR